VETAVKWLVVVCYVQCTPISDRGDTHDRSYIWTSKCFPFRITWFRLWY